MSQIPHLRFSHAAARTSRRRSSIVTRRLALPIARFGIRLPSLLGHRTGGRGGAEWWAFCGETMRRVRFIQCRSPPVLLDHERLLRRSCQLYRNALGLIAFVMENIDDWKNWIFVYSVDRLRAAWNLSLEYQSDFGILWFSDRVIPLHLAREEKKFVTSQNPVHSPTKPRILPYAFWGIT